VAITGGASFIGSHLAERLSDLGAFVSVVDNFSSGTRDNIARVKGISIRELDLERANFLDVRHALRGNEVVFHLAAVHGGRGYIDAHPADICSNLAIDHRVMEAATLEDVRDFVYASSACVYPPILQNDVSSDYQLKETDCDISDLRRPLSSDLEYGWAKLMGEIQLQSFVRQYALGGVSLRFVTAYGERENESHAVIALIYKAHQRMTPFVIWGNGEQSRDFTYVSDIVEGCLSAAGRIRDGRAINLGTGVRYTLRSVAELIFDILDFHPAIEFDPTKPTGVANRALDVTLARELLGWTPKVELAEGLWRTITWYVGTHTFTGHIDPGLLTERTLGRPATEPVQTEAAMLSA
jgi:UDP-glucose 4-epimerase